MQKNFALDRRALMIEAWTRTRAFMARNPHGRLRAAFASNLREAWVNAKARIAFAAKQAKMAARTAASLKAEIETLENTDTLGFDGIERLAELRREYAAKLAHRRELIAAAKGRFAAVTFIKKDGSERTMQVQPATLKFHVKGDAASEAAQKAVETRALRHPHLLAVWDAEAKAARSVNLATITRIAVNGTVHEFRAS